jgi:hypothetical protein
VFTHCGSGLTRDQRGERDVEQLAAARGVEARVASDGEVFAIR